MERNRLREAFMRGDITAEEYVRRSVNNDRFDNDRKMAVKQLRKSGLYKGTRGTVKGASV